MTRIDPLTGGGTATLADRYSEGYCDGWIHAVERMANLAGLGEQANQAYRSLWRHWQNELLPWRDNGDASAGPPVMDGMPADQ